MKSIVMEVMMSFLVVIMFWTAENAMMSVGFEIWSGMEKGAPKWKE